MSRDIPIEQHPDWPRFAAWCRELLDLPDGAELDAAVVNRAMATARVLADTGEVLDAAYAAVLREVCGGDPDA